LPNCFKSDLINSPGRLLNRETFFAQHVHQCSFLQLVGAFIKCLFLALFLLLFRSVESINLENRFSGEFFFLPPILHISFYLCALTHADETGFVLARVLFLSVLCFTLLSFLSFKPYHLYVWHLSVLILG